MHIFIHMCKEVKRLIIVTAGKWQKNARHEKCYGSEKKFLKIKIIKILFYSVIIKEVVQYYIFVLDQYLDIKLHSSRVKGHHVELWWFLLQKYRNENMLISNDIKEYPRRVRVIMWNCDDIFCRNIEMKISWYQMISSNIPGEWGRGVGVPRSSAKPPQAADALSRWEEQRHFPFSLFKL